MGGIGAKLLVSGMIAAAVASGVIVYAEGQSRPGAHPDVPRTQAPGVFDEKLLTQFVILGFFATLLDIPKEGIVIAFAQDARNTLPTATVPVKVFLDRKSNGIESTFSFIRQPMISASDSTYRPLGKTEAKDLRIRIGPQVIFETDGNYLVLPSHAIFSMWDIAVKTRDVETRAVFERLVDSIGSASAAVYVWSGARLDFIVYDDLMNPGAKLAKYRSTLAYVDGTGNLRSKINKVICRYYFTNAARYAATQADQGRLFLLGVLTLPLEAMEISGGEPR